MKFNHLDDLAVLPKLLLFFDNLSMCTCVGNHVRLSGQDVERGTFSHRHAVVHDQVRSLIYVVSILEVRTQAFVLALTSMRACLRWTQFSPQYTMVLGLAGVMVSREAMAERIRVRNLDLCVSIYQAHVPVRWGGVLVCFRQAVNCL